jgi:hypothetical protein
MSLKLFHRLGVKSYRRLLISGVVDTGDELIAGVMESKKIQVKA